MTVKIATTLTDFKAILKASQFLTEGTPSWRCWQRTRLKEEDFLKEISEGAIYAYDVNSEGKVTCVWGGQRDQQYFTHGRAFMAGDWDKGNLKILKNVLIALAREAYTKGCKFAQQDGFQKTSDLAKKVFGNALSVQEVGVLYGEKIFRCTLDLTKYFG